MLFFAEMNIQPGYIRYKDNTVYCIKTGQGPRLMLAFHGFGQESSFFLSLANALADEYTTIAIDLPGHGKTTWTDTYFDTEALMALVQGFKNDLHMERISLLGYSLGSRLCQCIIEKQANWVDTTFLLAPDSLKNNRLYKLATRNFLGKKIFRAICQNPVALMSIAGLLQKTGLLRKAQFDFLQKNLSDATRRRQVFEVWNVLSPLIPHKAIAHYQINKHKIGLHLLMGQQDSIFPVAHGKAFLLGLKNATLHTLPCGHNFASEKIMSQVAGIIQSTQPL